MNDLNDLPPSPPPSLPGTSLFPGANRTAARLQLDRFVERTARYGANRNFDRPGHPDVSRLSPYLSRRIITEVEVIQAVLATHSLAQVDKFVQEVCWRTYWKGWLEMRPSVWDSYRRELRELSRRLTPDQTAALARAEAGQTGIACFDHWAAELTTTHYLHNHARMWFASIWIFTLRLPWQLGADFFFRHLLDADAASNTLGWRWVAGLQTVGKHYLAQADNIQRFTEGRFDPTGHLVEEAPPLPPTDSPGPTPLALPETPVPTGPARERGLLLLGDDLHPESSPLASVEFAAIATGWDQQLAVEYRLAPGVVAFSREAMADAARRAEAHFKRPVTPLDPEDWVESILAWATQNQLRSLWLVYPTVGPWRDSVARLRAAKPDHLRLETVVRPWDRTLWPHATGGFFRFRQQLPAAVAHFAP
jgi:deoxyribodipyrimidine photo-lyase